MLGVLTAPLLLAGVVVLGEGRDACPTAAAVSERLEELLGDDGGGPPDALIFDGAVGALRVRLLSAEGAVREEKTLELAGSCDELADAVAALGVTWRSRLQAHEVPAPVLEPPPPPPARTPAPPTLRAPPPPPPDAADLELSIGLQTVAGVERWTTGLLLGAQLPLAASWNIKLAFDLSAPRNGVDDFSNRWRWVELRVVAGPSLRATTPTMFIDGHLGLGAGLDLALDTPEAASPYHRASPSLVLAGRWTHRRSASMPWFGVSITTYLDPDLDSPVKSTNVHPERWVMGLALGGTLTLEAGR